MMTGEEKKAMVERIRKAVETPDSVVNDLYAAGRLNELIAGAVRVTLYNLHYSKKDIEDAVYECQHGTFDLYTASELRRKGRE